MKKTAALLLALGFVFAAGAADEAKETVLLDKKFGTDYRWGKVVYIHGAKGLKDPEEIKALAAVSYDDKGAVLETDEKLNTMKDGSGRKIYLSNNLTRSVNLPENAGEKNFIMSFDIEGKGNVELIAVVRGKKGDTSFVPKTFSLWLPAGNRIHTLKKKLPGGAASVVCFCRLCTPGRIVVKSVRISLL